MNNSALVTNELHRKTKIIATVGPASRSPEKLAELIQAGTNVFRLNFSHGSPDEHLQTLKSIRSVAKGLNKPIAVLQDLAGPKIRITQIDGDYASLPDDTEIHLVASKDCDDASKTSSPERLVIETVSPAEILKPGDHMLLADGIIALTALGLETLDGRPAVRCKITKGGRLRSRVGIAFPDSTIDLPAATQKDLQHLEWGIDNGIDFVAVSFVQRAADILKLRDVIKAKKKDTQLIAKIERKSALANIDEILEASDGLMVARGDLGLELPLEQVPLEQKRLIESANFRGIPVIVATQMLHSMITSARPTRAEVTDIAFAVMSGADAVMLSEETAIGEHPAECVRYLGKIAATAEKDFQFDEYKLRLRDSDRLTVPDAVAYAACAAAIKVRASAIIVCTHTGSSARLAAKYRPQQRLYALSTEQETIRRMCLVWGVEPLEMPPTSTHQDEIETALRTVQSRDRFPNGSRAVISGGLAVGSPGSTSTLQIREMNYL